MMTHMIHAIHNCMDHICTCYDLLQFPTSVLTVDLSLNLTVQHTLHRQLMVMIAVLTVTTRTMEELQL